MDNKKQYLIENIIGLVKRLFKVRTISDGQEESSLSSRESGTQIPSCHGNELDKLLSHSPYSPDLAPAAISYFQTENDFGIFASK